MAPAQTPLLIEAYPCVTYFLRANGEGDQSQYVPIAMCAEAARAFPRSFPGGSVTKHQLDQVEQELDELFQTDDLDGKK